MTLASRICAFTVNPKVSIVQSGFSNQQQKSKFRAFSYRTKQRNERKKSSFKNTGIPNSRKKLYLTYNFSDQKTTKAD